MSPNMNIVLLEDWQTVSCNSCPRHNHRGRSIDTGRYVDGRMYELRVRAQTTILCEDCLTVLQETIADVKGVNG